MGGTLVPRQINNDDVCNKLKLIYIGPEFEARQFPCINLKLCKVVDTHFYKRVPGPSCRVV